MIKKTISRSTFQEHLITLIKDEMAIEAIKDDGIYSTFKYHYHRIPAANLTETTLHYYKFDGDGCSWIPMQKKILYKTCPELGGDLQLTLPYICSETLQKAADRIKLDVAKNDNAIWSTIKVEPWTDHFTVSYEKAYVTRNDEVDTSKWKPAAANAQAMEIENTKRTLRRIQENSYYGLYPRRSGLTTYAFDEKAKKDFKDSLAYYGLWEARAKKDAKEKEKKDMNITLMVVPEGMNKEFVNKVKANFQSNNSMRLFVASTDIDYSCEHEPIKTKYDLFEKWIKTGYVDVIYFMLDFEKDPDAKAFESFVRGITEAEVPGKIDVRVVYQKDDIRNDTNHLRTLYFDEADANEDAARATGSVVKEANAMKEVYSLDDTGLDIIKHSRGKIDASDELIIGKIMDVAFAEEDNPKKGGKK